MKPYRERLSDFDEYDDLQPHLYKSNPHEIDYPEYMCENCDYYSWRYTNEIRFNKKHTYWICPECGHRNYEWG